MAKTNFTKVEESLKKGIDDLNMKKIVDSTEVEYSKKKEEDETRLNKKKLAIYLIAELKRLHQLDERVYSKLGTSIPKAKQLLEHPTKLSEEEWTTVLKLRDKLEAYKKAFAKTLKPVNDEELVEKERGKQADKRFNIQEKWLPVD